MSVKQKGKPIICGKYAGPAVAGERIYITCNPPIVGRRVKIEKTTKGNKADLVMCEVFVEGIPGI